MLKASQIADLPPPGIGHNSSNHEATHGLLVLRKKDIIAAADRFVALKAEIARLTEELEGKDKKGGLRKVLLAALDGAPKAIAGKRVITATEIAGTPDEYVKITRDMVGTSLKVKSGRAGSTQLRVS